MTVTSVHTGQFFLMEGAFKDENNEVQILTIAMGFDRDALVRYGLENALTLGRAFFAVRVVEGGNVMGPLLDQLKQPTHEAPVRPV